MAQKSSTTPKRPVPPRRHQIHHDRRTRSTRASCRLHRCVWANSIIPRRSPAHRTTCHAVDHARDARNPRQAPLSSKQGLTDPPGASCAICSGRGSTGERRCTLARPPPRTRGEASAAPALRGGARGWNHAAERVKRRNTVQEGGARVGEGHRAGCCYSSWHPDSKSSVDSSSARFDWLAPIDPPRNNTPLDVCIEKHAFQGYTRPMELHATEQPRSRSAGFSCLNLE